MIGQGWDSNGDTQCTEEKMGDGKTKANGELRIKATGEKRGA